MLNSCITTMVPQISKETKQKRKPGSYMDRILIVIRELDPAHISLSSLTLYLLDTVLSLDIISTNPPQCDITPSV